MRSKVKHNGNSVVLDFSGIIVDDSDAQFYSWLGENFVCPRDIAEALNTAGGGPVTIRINSIGGDVFAGVDMYTALMDYSGPVTIEITSLAASAASVVAMAAAKEGNICRISPLGFVVLHNVMSAQEGDYRDMEAAAERLKKASASITEAYRRKTGADEAKILEMLDKETWLTAGEALEMGFVDEIMFSEGETMETQIPMRAVADQARRMVAAIPVPSAAKLRAMMEEKREQGKTEEALRKAARLLELEKNRY